MPDSDHIATARLLGQTVNVRFSASTGWGTRPATLTLVAPFQAFDNVQGQVSDLTIKQGSTELVWRDVRIAHVEADFPQNAGMWKVTLEDRRWKWQFGVIDGDYNVETPSQRIGDNVETGALKRPKSPRQLAALLLEALGETDFDISGLPSQPRPRKAWRAHNPRDELDRLCAGYGCEVCFDGPADRVSIVKVGTGAPFIDPSAYGGAVTRSDGQAIPPWPGLVSCVGGPSLFQTELEIAQAMGEDIDGSLKPIDELSYAPAGGWLGQIGGFGSMFRNIFGTYTRDGETLYVRDLAEKCVFRWWRPSKQWFGIIEGVGPRITRVPQATWDGKASGDADAVKWAPDTMLTKEGLEFAPRSLDDLGPFLNSRLERDSVTNNRLPIAVRGNFFDVRQGKLANVTGAVWPHGAKFNNETKCVELDRPAFLIEAETAPRVGFTGKVAKLRVIIGYQCSYKGVPIGYDKFRPNTGPNYGAGVRVEHHEELVREVIEDRPDNGANIVDNLPEINAAADFYMNAINAEYEVRPTANIEVPLVQYFTPDGVLRSISWQGGSEQAPTTTLNYNSQRSSLHPDYRDTPQQQMKRVADQAAREREANRLGVKL